MHRHTPLLVMVFLTGWSSFGHAADGARAGSLLTNGSFEELSVMARPEPLRKRGFGLGPAGKPFRWARGWTIDPATKGAKIGIQDEGAPGGGKHCLHMEADGSTHVHTQGGVSGRKRRPDWHFVT